MTSYAHKIDKKDYYTIDVTLSSVNSRYGEYFCRLPDYFASKRYQIERILRDKIGRGKINFTATFSFDQEYIASRATINYDIIKKYADDFKSHGIGLEITLSDIFKLPGVLTTLDTGITDEEWGVFEKVLSETIFLFIKTADDEGCELKKDMEKRIALIIDLVKQIEQRSEGIKTDYKELLLKKIERLDITDIIDQERLYKEVSFFGEQIDYTEEIVRLNSHIQVFQAMLRDDTVEKSKRMSFLLQEMNREINTAGSKCRDAEVAQLVVTVKEELEKIREQTQNIW